MTEVTPLVYPTETFVENNYEYLIMWMLANNEVCTWSDFIDEPLEIKQATLSNNLQNLMTSAYVEKVKRAHYKITPKGINYFINLTEILQGTNLKSPPKSLLRQRDYQDIILWMLFHNEHCKWSDFLADPVKINQSSLSKYLNLLINQDLVEKANKEYHITEQGKEEYYTLIKKYNLDKQSMLDEKLNQILAQTEKTDEFFTKYEIVDKNLKYRFLNLKILLDYKKIKNVLTDESDFNKILLYLAYNHPNQYPSFVSPKEFAKKFFINHRTLDYFTFDITDHDLFKTKFFKISKSEEEIYYFHEGEKIEKILAAIVEECITKQTFLSGTVNNIRTPSKLVKKEVIKGIISEICGSIFDPNLKHALVEFIPEYIQYLAYKFENQPILQNSIDKLEGFALYRYPQLETEENSSNKHKCGFSDPKYCEYFDVYNKHINNGDMEKAEEVLMDIYKSRHELDYKSLSSLAVLFIRVKNNEIALKLFNYLEKHAPDEEALLFNLNNKAYLYLYSGELQKAFDISEELIARDPDNANFHDSHGEMLANTGYHERAIEEYKIALNCEEWDLYRYQTYIKLAQSLQALGKWKEGLNMINNSILNIPIPDRTYNNTFYSQAIKIKKEIQANL